MSHPTRWQNLFALLIAASGTICASMSVARGSVIVPFSSATATFSQASFPITAAADGSFATGFGAGWAIDPHESNPQTAVFETPTLAAGPMTFTLLSGGFGSHELGRFRLSVTTANHSAFADGLTSGGDVGAPGIWTVLDPVTITAIGLDASMASAPAPTLTEQGDNSILASGNNPEYAKYIIGVSNTVDGVTGIRLEAMTDPSLPLNGPGRQSGNGNFVLYEIQLEVPEPTGIGAMIFLAGCGMMRRRRGSAIASK